jgi:TPR repeat protein
LAQTSIQKDLQHQLVTETRSYLTKAQSKLNEFISESDHELHTAAIEAMERSDFGKAIGLLEKVKNKDHYDYNTLGLVYAISKIDIDKAKEYFKKAIEKQHAYAMYNLAYLYQTEFKDLKKAEQYYLMAVEKQHSDAMHNLASLYQTAYKDLKKAEKYYLMAIDEQNSDAMFNLALLYHKELNDYKKAEQYYLMAVEHDHSNAMYNLGVLYEYEFKDIEKAGHYYHLAIRKENIDAMNNQAWLNFETRRNKIESLIYAQTAYENDPNIIHTHTYATILLWNNKFEVSYEVASEFLNNYEAFEILPNHITIFLMLLLAKRQYYYALKIFNKNYFDLKDRFKPIYYALMYFIREDYPNEFRKMGSELKETVDEVIGKIQQMEIDYA